MSEQEQGKINGSVMVRLKEADSLLTLSLSEAKRMGEQLSHLGRLLTSHPEVIQFENRGCDVIFQRRETNEKMLTLKSSDLEYLVVVELVERIRTLTIMVTGLQEEKRRLGF
jgi:hypothetical protein